MELTELENRLLEYDSDIQFEDIESIYPFNEYEFIINRLINENKITYQQYLELRDEYISRNPYLWIFEISSPRGFGEKFAQTYIQAKSDNIKKASKKLDPNYKGEYDLWYKGIKIEVKASRAVDANSDKPLYIKALSSNTKRTFVMNFQQLKPQYCDIFIWVAVFRDKIYTWIINSKDVKNNKYYSIGQHRGNKGNEGQLHITNENIGEFEKYRLKDNNIEQVIKEVYNET
jgi:hypothetical protein